MVQLARTPALRLRTKVDHDNLKARIDERALPKVAQLRIERDKLDIRKLEQLVRSVMMQVFTSIAPHLQRLVEGEDVTDRYLTECIDSWRRLGFVLVSLNNPTECETLRQRFSEVEFRSVESKIPTIEDFLTAIRATDAPLVGIANCDCIVGASAPHADWMRDQAARGLVMMERQNYSPETLQATGRSCHGFDAFLFPRDATHHIAKMNRLRIGETWWDYEFPLLFVEAGFPLAHCVALLHVDHPIGWDYDQWRRNAKATRSRFGELLGISELDEPADTALGDFSFLCFKTLKAWAVKDGSFGTRIAANTANTILAHQNAILAHQDTIVAHQREHEDHVTRLNDVISYQEGLLYSRSMPSARRNLGEFLCTVSGLLRKAHVLPQAADALHVKGVGLQRQADEEHMPLKQ